VYSDTDPVTFPMIVPFLYTSTKDTSSELVHAKVIEFELTSLSSRLEMSGAESSTLIVTVCESVSPLDSAMKVMS